MLSDQSKYIIYKFVVSNLYELLLFFKYIFLYLHCHLMASTLFAFVSVISICSVCSSSCVLRVR